MVFLETLKRIFKRAVKDKKAAKNPDILLGIMVTRAFYKPVGCDDGTHFCRRYEARRNPSGKTYNIVKIDSYKTEWDADEENNETYTIRNISPENACKTLDTIEEHLCATEIYETTMLHPPATNHYSNYVKKLGVNVNVNYLYRLNLLSDLPQLFPATPLHSMVSKKDKNLHEPVA